MNRKLTIEELTYVQEEVNLKGKKVSVAYLLTVFLSPLGVHLGYLGRQKEALFRAFFSMITLVLFVLAGDILEKFEFAELTMQLQQYGSALFVFLISALAIQGIWLTIDLIYAPKRVAEFNKAIEKDSDIKIRQAGFAAEQIAKHEAYKHLTEEVSRKIEDDLNNEVNEQKRKIDERVLVLTSHFKEKEEFIVNESIRLKNDVLELSELTEDENKKTASILEKLSNKLENDLKSFENKAESVKRNLGSVMEEVEVVKNHVESFKNEIETLKSDFEEERKVFNKSISLYKEQKENFNRFIEDKEKEILEIKKSSFQENKALQEEVLNPTVVIYSEAISENSEENSAVKKHDDFKEISTNEEPTVNEDIDSEIKSIKEETINLFKKESFKNKEGIELIEDEEVEEVNSFLNETEENYSKEDPQNSSKESNDFNSEHLTVKESLKKKKGKLKVKGVILGSMNSNKEIETKNFTFNSNIVISDEKENLKDILVVQIPKEKRASLSLKNNPELISSTISISGFKSNYFGNPGIKNVSDIKIID